MEQNCRARDGDHTSRKLIRQGMSLLCVVCCVFVFVVVVAVAVAVVCCRLLSVVCFNNSHNNNGHNHECPKDHHVSSQRTNEQVITQTVMRLVLSTFAYRAWGSIQCGAIPHATCCLV